MAEIVENGLKRRKLNSHMPAPPEFLSLDEANVDDTIQTILAELDERSKRQESINLVTSQLHPSIEFYKQKFHMGMWKTDDDVAVIVSLCHKLLAAVPVPNSVVRQQSKITECLSGAVSLLALDHFLYGVGGKLITLDMLQSDKYSMQVNDNEYLMGVIQFSRELERYAVGRATAGDVKSVVVCKLIVTEILEELMKFDFRNGPIRRQYDGVKYCKKKLEDILYELSLGMNETNMSDFNTLDSFGPLALHEFKGLQDRMKEYDLLREKVIKESRDIQKLGKNCVYSLHRGGKSLIKAREQLEDGKKKASDIACSYLTKEPTLRNGTYANAIEEWAEGRIYEEWLKFHKILSLKDIRRDIPEITLDEYLGGLGDFTGEVGRFAVAAATRRDKPMVKRAKNVVMTVSKILLHINMNGKVPSRMFKKISTLKNNLRKLEHLTYEMSLVKGSIAVVVAASNTDDDIN